MPRLPLATTSTVCMPSASPAANRAQCRARAARRTRGRRTWRAEILPRGGEPAVGEAAVTAQPCGAVSVVRERPESERRLVGRARAPCRTALEGGRDALNPPRQCRRRLAKRLSVLGMLSAQTAEQAFEPRRRRHLVAIDRERVLRLPAATRALGAVRRAVAGSSVLQGAPAASGLARPGVRRGPRRPQRRSCRPQAATAAPHWSPLCFQRPPRYQARRPHCARPECQSSRPCEAARCGTLQRPASAPMGGRVARARRTRT